MLSAALSLIDICGTQSLERMALSLSKDKYKFSPAELEGLSMQIRRGDLTPVLKVYEEDLKSPLKSAIAGSLIRSLLIQVQKMKVRVGCSRTYRSC